jgi:hypothetical protein
LTGVGAAMVLLLSACTPGGAPPDGAAGASSAPVTLPAGPSAAPEWSPGQPAASTPAASGPEASLPPTTGVFDYQLGGASSRVGTPSRQPTVVVRDASVTPLAGAYSVCYVNGFQTQPGEAAFWRARAHLLVKDSNGRPRVDPVWPDEYILDPTSAAQRAEILRIVGPTLSRCAQRGFRAVELDNLDTFTRIKGVPKTGALELAAAYVRLAHSQGLAVAQKNTPGLGAAGKRSIGFDFAIAESCAAYRECGAYRAVYGAHVLQIEYPGELSAQRRTFAQACADRDRSPLTILRDRPLAPAGQRGHLYRSC